MVLVSRFQKRDRRNDGKDESPCVVAVVRMELSSSRMAGTEYDGDRM